MAYTVLQYGVGLGLVDGPPVHWGVFRTSGILEQLCARVRAETWGRAATAPGCLSTHGNGHGYGHCLQDAG